MCWGFFDDMFNIIKLAFCQVAQSTPFCIRVDNMPGPVTCTHAVSTSVWSPKPLRKQMDV